jgi:hypothetical protein
LVLVGGEVWPGWWLLVGGEDVGVGTDGGRPR